MNKDAEKGSPQRNNTEKLLNLYIRNNKKKALLVHSRPEANLRHISNVIASLLRVPPEAQTLFYNGQRVEPDSERTHLQVEDQGVIHLIDRRRVTKEITINIRRLHLPETQ